MYQKITHVPENYACTRKLRMYQKITLDAYQMVMVLNSITIINVV